MKQFAISAVIVSLLSAAPALACVPGTKCVTVPDSQITVSPYGVGDMLPRGKYQVLLNAQYYGLPQAKDGSWYFKVDRRVMRVRPDTLEVLEDVTDQTNRAFY